MRSSGNETTSTLARNSTDKSRHRQALDKRAWVDQKKCEALSSVLPWDRHRRRKPASHAVILQNPSRLPKPAYARFTRRQCAKGFQNEGNEARQLQPLPTQTSARRNVHRHNATASVVNACSACSSRLQTAAMLVPMKGCGASEGTNGTIKPRAQTSARGQTQQGRER